jgi:hypothetical protein
VRTGCSKSGHTCQPLWSSFGALYSVRNISGLLVNKISACSLTVGLKIRLVQAYLILLLFANTALFTNWSFVATRAEQICRRHFPNSMCSLHVSVSHFGNSHNIPNFSNSISVYLLRWSVISDLWCYYCNWLGRHEPHPYKTANLIHKCCVCSGCYTDWPFPPPSPTPRASLIPETQQY